jgi:hypothetical protein
MSAKFANERKKKMSTKIERKIIEFILQMRNELKEEDRNFDG